jgi:hypothetical protein
LKKWTEESLQDLESYSWVTLNRSSSWSDIERTSSLVVKTVQSVQLAKNEMYDEYVYVKQYVTGGTISEWTAQKLCQLEDGLKWSLTSIKTILFSEMYLS